MSAPPPPHSVEIVWFAPSDAYRARHPEGFLADFYAETRRHGVLAAFHGPQLGAYDPEVAWILVWKSVAHHEAFMARPIYADLVVPLMDAFAGRNEMRRVLAPPAPAVRRALAAPATELARLTPLAARARAALPPLLDKLAKALAAARGCAAAAWGPCADDDTLLVFVGWADTDAPRRAARDPGVAAAWARIAELAAVERRFAALRPLP